MPPSTLRLRSGQASLRTGIACVYIPRFAVEVERQRRSDIAARLVLIGEATVLDCSLGAETSGVRPGMRMSEAIGLCHQAVVLPPDAPHYQRRFEEALDGLGGGGGPFGRLRAGSGYRLSLPGGASRGAPAVRRRGYLRPAAADRPPGRRGHRRREVRRPDGRPAGAAGPGEGAPARRGGGVPDAPAHRLPAGERFDALAAAPPGTGDDGRYRPAAVGGVPAAVRAGGEALLGAGRRHR